MIPLEQFLRPPWVMGSEGPPGTLARMVAHLRPHVPLYPLSDRVWIHACEVPYALVLALTDGTPIGAMKLSGGLSIDAQYRGNGFGRELIAALYQTVGPERWIVPPKGVGIVHVMTPAGRAAYTSAWRSLVVYERGGV